jgi:hypothetical protein
MDAWGRVAMIRAAYERLFVAFYGWSPKIDPNAGGFNVYYASLMLSLALLLNAATIAIVLELLTGRQFLHWVAQTPRVPLGIVFVIYSFSQYLYFRWNDRYQALVVAHARDELSLAREPRKTVVAYMVLSVVVLAAMMYARINLTVIESPRE